MFWDWFRICFSGAANPNSSAKYDEYEEERATTVRTENKPVDVDFVVGSVLGTGGFGLVKDGMHRETLSKCALKFVYRKDLSKKDEELFLKEAGILTGLKHGHVVEMLGFYKWDQAYCLTMEHMGGGDLCDDILRRVFYSEACARRIILQVLDALAFLHRRGICHRDVKPENLLLHQRGGEHVKLADFGFATVLSRPTYKVVEPVGSPGYAAPELLRVLPYDGQVDVFSLGVVSFVLLSGYLPFGGAAGGVAEVMEDTLKCNPSFDEIQWSAVSEEGRNFVKALLCPNPRERPTAESATFHPWMKVRGKTLLSRSLSDRRSGEPKPLLAEFQRLQRKRLKAAVGVVLAANRLNKSLRTGHQDRHDKAAGKDGDHQPEVKEEDTVPAPREAGINSNDNEKMMPSQEKEKGRHEPD